MESTVGRKELAVCRPRLGTQVKRWMKRNQIEKPKLKENYWNELPKTFQI
jgi:hypothetical protein